MSKITGSLTRLRRSLSRRRFEAEMAAEMHHHVEAETERRIATGEDPATARHRPPPRRRRIWISRCSHRGSARSSDRTLVRTVHPRPDLRRPRPPQISRVHRGGRAHAGHRDRSDHHDILLHQRLLASSPTISGRRASHPNPTVHRKLWSNVSRLYQFSRLAAIKPHVRIDRESPAAALQSHWNRSTRTSDRGRGQRQLPIAVRCPTVTRPLIPTRR